MILGFSLARPFGLDVACVLLPGEPSRVLLRMSRDLTFGARWRRTGTMNEMRFAPMRFPAAVGQSRVLDDFVITETRYGGGAALPTHSHENGCVIVVLHGTFRERSDGRPRHCAPGLIIVRPKGEPHSNRFDERGGRCLNIELAPQWLAQTREVTGLFDRSSTFVGAPYWGMGRRLYQEAIRSDEFGLAGQPPGTAALHGSQLGLESLLLALADDPSIDARRPPGTPPRWLLDVRDRIDARVAAPTTLSVLAAGAGVHPVHLATTFRRYFGKTVGSYLRQMRIEYACRAVTRSGTFLSDVALAAGFADQSHMGRTFKRVMGMTPAAYRSITSV